MRHCLAFLLKPGLRVLRVTVNSSSMGRLASQDEATKDALAMRRIDTAEEAAEVAAQMTEEALGQVGGVQAVTPARRPA